MGTYVKRGVGLGALIVGLVLVGAAQAAVIVPAGDGSYSYSTTLTAADARYYPNVDPWGSANGNPVNQQDKVWTYVSSSSPTGVLLGMAPVYFSIDSLGGVDHHSLEFLGNASHFKLKVAGTYTLEYTLQVAPGFERITHRSDTGCQRGTDKRRHPCLPCNGYQGLLY